MILLDACFVNKQVECLFAACNLSCYEFKKLFVNSAYCCCPQMVWIHQHLVHTIHAVNCINYIEERGIWLTCLYVACHQAGQKKGSCRSVSTRHLIFHYVSFLPAAQRLSLIVPQVLLLLLLLRKLTFVSSHGIFTFVISLDYL